MQPNARVAVLIERKRGTKRIPSHMNCMQVQDWGRGEERLNAATSRGQTQQYSEIWPLKGTVFCAESMEGEGEANTDTNNSGERRLIS